MSRDAFLDPLGELATVAPRVWAIVNAARLRAVRRVRLDGAVCRGPSTRRVLALTFDDGPDERFTPAILDALAAAGARATFFFSGAAMERFPSIARRTAEAHEIGTHLYSHDCERTRTLVAFDDELERALQVHERILGNRPTALRFPFGDRGRVRRADLERRGMTAFHWTFSSEDSTARTASAIESHVVPRLHAGAIVLFHDGRAPGSTLGLGSRAPTVEALPRILRAVAERQFAAVTLRDLLR